MVRRYNDDFGIPTIKAQGLELYQPITSSHKWGVRARGSETNRGLVHFYTDDYKFSTMWKYPQKLLQSNCQHVIEVNYSTYHTFPMAYMLWQLYQKRYMTALWQKSNVITWVDMNVDPMFYECNFIGVPRDHCYYATRYLANYPRVGLGFESLERDYEQVMQHCTVPFIFLVYAGGNKVRDYCTSRNWLWLPDKWGYPWGEVQEQHRGVEETLREARGLGQLYRTELGELSRP